ncbi:MAG: DegQ family serine endoprotease [Desulfobulbus sp.]|jgi:serine protease Do
MQRRCIPSKPILLFLCLFFCALLVPGALPAHADDGQLQLLDQSAKAFSSVVKKAGPAVVHVKVEKEKTARSGPQFPHDLFNDPFFERFFGPQFRGPRQDRDRTYRQRAAGSGFLISSDGYIMTNNHVVEDAANIKVLLADKRELPARVIGTDPQSDVALIKVDAKNLPTLVLGNSDALEVGEWVIAIGSPFDLNQTVTVGVVSAKGRNRVGITDYENFIQTDAAINPGNSGGPLLNIRGEVVGINTAIFSRSGGYMGIGFAIPVNMAKTIQQQLRESGKVSRGWLGVVIQDVNEDLAQSFGGKSAGGALVAEVSPDSPAGKGGLQQGDIITHINGQQVTDVADLRNRIAMTPPNTRLDLRVFRDGKTRDISVRVGEQPADMAAGMKGGGASSLLGGMGLTLQDLTDEIAAQFGYAKNQGVLISDVAAGSPAAQVGLQTGALIEEVNRTRVHNLKELRSVLKQSGGKRVLLRVRFGQHSQYVVLQER